MSNMTKSVAAVVGLLVMTIVVSWQLFLFAVPGDPQGLLASQGGRYHLWFAIIAAVIACMPGALMFHFFGRHDRNEWSQAPRAPLGPAPPSTSDYPTNNSPAPAPVACMHWALLNPWLSEGQSDDRSPMPGTDGDSSGSLSARRSSARRTHQAMFKKWSQARHD
jgi:hypothetical protein